MNGKNQKKKLIPNLILCSIFLIIFAFVSGCAVANKKIARDGHYEKLASSVIRDTQTGLEWYVGPDRDTAWDAAKSWVNSLSVAGGSWRMPARKELKSLYQKGAGKRNMTSLLKTTGWYVWTGETKGSLSAWLFDFGNGLEGWDYRPGSNFNRGFAVRSR